MENGLLKVLVTSARTKAALAVTKSLGEKGIIVICADHSYDSLSFYTKYCKGRIIYPNPEIEPEKFIDFLLDHIKINSYDILFPITDIDMYLISKNLDLFSPYIKVAGNPHHIFMKVLDKSATIEMAKKLGIPIPETILLENIDDIYKIAEELRYPVVIKPRQSVTFISDEARICNTKYIFSKEDLISNYISLHKKIPYPLIQEYIKGEEIGVFLLLDRGSLKAVFSHRRIRSINPLGGVSCMRESVGINSMMKVFAVKLLEEINWNGIAMVEFKIDSSDNIPKLMEINGRFWGSLQLAILSGVDFPYLLLNALMGETTSPILDYKKGVKCRDLYGDFIHFYNVLMRPDKRFEYPEKFSTARQFIKFNERDLHYDSISLEDPKLMLKTFWEIIKLPYLHKTKKKGNYEIN